MTNSAAASAFGQWLQSISPKYQLDLTTVSRAGADAGFRSYHRIAAADGRSFIAMNAEGETPESFASFIKVDGLLRNEAGLNAPEIFEADTDHRFMLLSDLGRETYLDVLNEDNARELMDRATTALVAWQKISRPNVLPAYSREVLQRELELFPTWYVGRHRGVEWTEEQQQDWDILKYPIHDAFYHFMLELNKLYLTEPALYRDDYERNGFCWVDCHQEQKGIYAMERRSGDSRILILLHMSDEATQNYTFTLPDCGGLKPLLTERINQCQIIFHEMITIVRPVTRIRIIDSQVNNNNITGKGKRFFKFFLLHVRAVSFI